MPSRETADALPTPGADDPVSRPGGFFLVRVFRVPLLLHWSVPAGAVLPSLIVGFKPLQSLSLCVGFVLLVLVHEAGHAIAAWSTGLNVRAIVVAGFGGLCFTESQPSSRPRALALYSGGLIAQILLFAGTLVLVSAFGNPPNVFLSSLALMFTLINAIMFIGNAVPTRVGSGLVTDGYLIWRVLRGDRLDGA